MISYVFGKAIVVYLVLGQVYVHDLRTGFFNKPWAACISKDARDGGYEFTNLPCIDIQEDEVWSHVLDCSRTECREGVWFHTIEPEGKQ